MPSARDTLQRWTLYLIAVGATALLTWYGTGLDPQWPFLWFAPLPVLLVATRASAGQSFGLAFLAWLLGDLNLWSYFHDALGAPLPILAQIFGSEALMFALAVLLFHGLLRRGHAWLAALAFPAFWVSFEYVFNLFSPHGTAVSLAYSQLKFLPFLQLASVTGPWGMSFLLLLFSSSLAVAWHLAGRAPKQAFALVGAGFALILAALVFGALRLAAPESSDTVKVGLIASDQPGDTHVQDPGAATARLFNSYAAAAKSLAAAGAQVIVMPEKLGVAVDQDDADAVFQALADSTQADIVAGMVHVTKPVKYNEARLYRPGQPVQQYDKEHMLPPFESMFKPGTSLLTFPHGADTLGVAVCKDMDFISPARRYGAADVGLMLVPAWDFDVDWLEHGHMAIMRGVESGFAVARAAKRSSLYVSDDRGRILAETRTDPSGIVTLLAKAPAVHERTLYLAWGDWFAWIVLALLALCVLSLFLPRHPRDESGR